MRISGSRTALKFYDDARILECRSGRQSCNQFFMMARGFRNADPGARTVFKKNFFMMTRGSENADPGVRTVFNFFL
jgi:hypothetical protein